ncbi:MAG TPA: alpha/beta hydrolase family protein [Terriglobia bacterium]|nr:alpha/beta hydrolase family protein [Terriglobia bacterium]
MNRARRTVGTAVLAFLGLGLCALPSHAATGSAECLAVQSRILHRPVGYCAILPPGYHADKTRRYPVLYLLHGLGENDQFLIRSGGLNLVQDLWDKRRMGKFLIVTPDAGSSFDINSRNGRERYEDFFIQEFLPYIGRRYRALAGRRNRGIAGLSMGGYGALHLAFRHPQLFGSVSAESAALLERLPAVTVAGPQPQALRMMFGGAFGSPPDPAFWKQNSPLTLARTAQLAGMKIYFDCGAQDDYGFDRGARALDRILTARGIPHEFHLYPGGHNWRYFAAHLPALLEFESHAFGLNNISHP